MRIKKYFIMGENSGLSKDAKIAGSHTLKITNLFAGDGNNKN
jgi:hypothetical protein